MTSLIAPATPLIAVTQVEAAKVQLQKAGHVGIAELYDPSLAATAAPSLYQGFPRARITVLGEQAAGLEGIPSQAAPMALPMLDHAEILRSCSSFSAGGFFTQYITMTPNTQGSTHIDRTGFTGLVGITTVMGSSLLLIEDGSWYLLMPGTVVYLDHSRRLKHKGVAGPDGERIGLVVTRLSANFG